MHLVPVVPTTSTPPPYPPPRYDLFRRTKEPTSLEAVHAWRDKTQSKLTWIEGSTRAEDNRITHTMTPVLTCTMYEQPDESVQTYLRCTASHSTEALEGAKSAVRSRLGGRVLLHFYARVEDSGEEWSHCRYTVVDISYTYRLDNWAVEECRGEGSTKKEAQQQAAMRLLASRTYCMFTRNLNGRY